MSVFVVVVVVVVVVGGRVTASFHESQRFFCPYLLQPIKGGGMPFSLLF